MLGPGDRPGPVSAPLGGGHPVMKDRRETAPPRELRACGQGHWGPQASTAALSPEASHHIPMTVKGPAIPRTGRTDTCSQDLITLHNSLSSG